LTEKDEIYMKRCLELARKGLGLTRTNPLVGCVIVHRDRIIGEGYHHEFGGPHAEVNAIRSVNDPSLLPESVLYCNLEPCSHHGKTPPCSLLICRKGVRKVVIANLDPNPSVNGQGVRQLEEAGIEVRSGCLEEAGYILNRRFFHFHLKKRPYVILKWAQTKDGYLDVVREPGDLVGTNWITDAVSRTLVHKWRSEESAIMVGTNTVIADNPRLNVRRWTGFHPVRITLDRKGRLSPDAKILDGTQDTLVFTGVPGKYSGRTRSIQVDPSYTLDGLMEELYDLQVLSVFVEGGAELHGSFIQSGLWDEARVFTGKVQFSQGIRAPSIASDPVEILHFRDNTLELYTNHVMPLR
jgi:diaminohydroxyphosphoribosylaminopyrimidine deaminase/5-amino-6-(5-phosphoribosylamino)uracil reductase